MTHGDSHSRRQRPLAPRGVCIGVGAVLSAAGGTLLSVAAAGVLGGGALVTTVLAGGRPNAAVQSVAQPAHVNPPPPAPAARAAAPASIPPSTGASVTSAVSAPAAPAPAPPPPAPPPPPQAPPVTAAPPPPHAARAARAVAVPTTGAAAGTEPLAGAALLGAGAVLILGSLRRPAPRRPLAFDDELPARVSAVRESPQTGRWCILGPVRRPGVARLAD